MHIYNGMKKTALFVALFLVLSQALQAQTPLITEDWQLSSPYSESSEGRLEYLIDGRLDNFWHSKWKNYIKGEYHYVEVELREPVKGLFQLYMHRRDTRNDHPIEILLSGSRDYSSWYDITTLSFPYTDVMGVNSEIFAIQEDVNYIRIGATKTTSSAVNGFWHAAEIQLYQLSEQYEFDSSLEGVKINEVQVANIDQYIDNSYNYGGWIELYNHSAESHFLTDVVVRHTDADEIVEEYTLNLNHGALNGGAYMCLWFDHNSADGTFGDKAHLQIPFKLDPEGGCIELFNSEGVLIDAVDYPAAIARCSYARTADAGEEWNWTAYATPAQSNEGVCFATERLAVPEVSVESTLFAEEEEISFTVDIPEGTRLMYTTDGSAPTVNHGSESFDGVFSTNETMVYRFVLVANDKLPSPVVTRTFIKDENNLEIPILCLSTHPDNLYSNEIGVYTRGTNGIPGNGQGSACNWNMDWERPANVEYLVKGDDGYTPVINQEVEFEIAGGWTRAYGGDENWEMKSSFRLKSGKLFEGKNSFNYPFFADSKPYNKYKTLLVRNGGNDTYGRIFDPAIQEIVRRSGFYVDCQAWQPCHVFFNGKYLGMLNLRENNNRNFAESEYGVDKDDTDQFELNGTLGYEQKSGTRDAFWQWLLLTKDLAADPTNEDIWQQICALVDIDEFCNYMATECYIGSNDWLTNSNNLKGFRSRVDDGKFHLVLFDADQAFTVRDMLSQVYGLMDSNDSRYAENDGVSYLAEILVNMLTYEPFRKQFVNAFSIVDGSVFEPERSLSIIDEMEAYVRPALALEGEYNLDELDESLSSLRDFFYNSSERDLRKHYMKNTLGLLHECRVIMESNIPEARLLLDGQEIPTRRFDGTIYGPAAITAKAPAGYVFKGWEILPQETIIPLNGWWQYYDQGSLDDTDWNAYTSYDGVWNNSYSPAPFGYGNIGIGSKVPDYNTLLEYGDNPDNKRPTYYFRTEFYLEEQPSEAETYLLDYYVDDGVVLFLNGDTVGRHRMSGDISYDKFSDGYDEVSPYHGVIVIPSSLLCQGVNVIAAEVHNNSKTSSDIYFTAQLTKMRRESSSSFMPSQETFVIDESMDSGTYTLTAIYDKVSTPAQVLECGASPVRINEVGAGNDIYINDYYKRKDWVELYNTTDQAIDVSGMYLSDKRSKPQKYQISAEGTSATTIIEPYGKLIVWCDEEDPISQLHANFKLSNSDGSYVTLQAADGTWGDELMYYEQNRWQTYGRYPDGGQLTHLMDHPTIALPNMLPLYVLASDDVESWTEELMAITLAMQPGWNWVSHNLASDVDRTRFTGYAQYLMGKSSEYLYSLSTGKWSGELELIKPGTGYKMQFTTATDITLRGNLYDVATPINIIEGWNWIGFPLYNATALEAALKGYSPTEGDAIVGINGFATYEQGSWDGSLTSLVPGQAYLLKSGSAQMFCWNSLSEPARSSRIRRYALPVEDTKVQSPWQADIHAYPHVVSIIATIDESVGITPANSVLAAFCGDECRGVAELVDELFYLNIHGVGGENITFKIVDDLGQVYVPEQTLVFTPETIVGTRQQPFVFRMKDIETLVSLETITDVVSTTYYTVNGVRVAQPISGVFIKQIVYADGRIVIEKIVK